MSGEVATANTSLADTLAGWAVDGRGNHRRRDAVWPQLVQLVAVVELLPEYAFLGAELVRQPTLTALRELRAAVEAQR